MRYTKELLSKAAKHSESIAEVIRFLGLRHAGGTHTHLSRRMVELGVDTTHFKGRRANSGKNHRGGARKWTWKELLVKRTTGKRASAVRLRRALIEMGREYKCETCGLDGTWQGRPLMLQVDHRNRDWLDDQPDNLQFQCPNCHSQSPGWCGSKGYTGVVSAAEGDRARRLLKCGKKTRRNRKQPTKIKWPSPKKLASLVRESSYKAVGRILGVSDVAVRNHLLRGRGAIR